MDEILFFFEQKIYKNMWETDKLKKMNFILSVFHERISSLSTISKLPAYLIIFWFFCTESADNKNFFAKKNCNLSVSLNFADPFDIDAFFFSKNFKEKNKKPEKRFLR